MAKAPRALLTDRQRELLDQDEPDNRKYQAVCRVRKSIEERFADDIEVLAENHPQLHREVKKAVFESGEK